MIDMKKRILHVEDDSDFHTYVDALLHDTVHVTSVYTTKDARELLVGSTFDLFLLDLVLKDGSGSSFSRELKEKYPKTPIVILSSHNVTGVIDEAEVSFVKSNLDEDEFTKTIGKLAGN